MFEQKMTKTEKFNKLFFFLISSKSNVAKKAICNNKDPLTNLEIYLI